MTKGMDMMKGGKRSHTEMNIGKGKGDAMMKGKTTTMKGSGMIKGGMKGKNVTKGMGMPIGGLALAAPPSKGHPNMMKGGGMMKGKMKGMVPMTVWVNPMFGYW